MLSIITKLLHQRTIMSPTQSYCINLKLCHQLLQNYRVNLNLCRKVTLNYRVNVNVCRHLSQNYCINLELCHQHKVTASTQMYVVK